jgi:hypothetical protein
MSTIPCGLLGFGRGAETVGGIGVRGMLRKRYRSIDKSATLWGRAKSSGGK